MRRLKEGLKFLIPILILAIGITFVFVFEFYIKDKVNTVQVIVAKEEIPFKERITKKHLKVENIKKDNQVSDTFRPDEMDYLIGKLASIKINKGTQIYPELIDDFDLIPDESKGEFIAPLPDKWLFAVPGSLRRSYIADIYVIGNEDQAIIESIIRDAKEQYDHEDYEGMNESVTDGETLDTSEESDLIVKASYEPILKDVRISSVKDSGNREVTELEDNPNSATANVSSLEIVADSEMLQTIKENMDKGYKLYIVYKYQRSNEESEE